ncbi:hypothetical protein J6590_087815 [Homalodisca vitripennis]|nr:hypothetical protein J6590_087815 [Homalodisca vitripennis]
MEAGNRHQVRTAAIIQGGRNCKNARYPSVSAVMSLFCMHTRVCVELAQVSVGTLIGVKPRLMDTTVPTFWVEFNTSVDLHRTHQAYQASGSVSADTAKYKIIESEKVSAHPASERSGFDSRRSNIVSELANRI